MALCSFCVIVQNGGIFVDFRDGSGDDSVYEDVYNSFDASGGQSCNVVNDVSK